METKIIGIVIVIAAVLLISGGLVSNYQGNLILHDKVSFEIPEGCSETDGGKDFWIYGVLIMHSIDTSGKHYYTYHPDKCMGNEITLQETHCHITHGGPGQVFLSDIEPDLSLTTAYITVEKDCDEFGDGWTCKNGACVPPPPEPYCGDHVCTPGLEDCDGTTPIDPPYFCPSDCMDDCTQFMDCPNDHCDLGESYFNCPEDCAPPRICGDDLCVTPEVCDQYAACTPESHQECPWDCPPVTCGNDECEYMETCINCVEDCDVFPADPEKSCMEEEDGCPNNFEVCVYPEDGHTCPLECGIDGATCGDGYCLYPETCLNCGDDCGLCRSTDNYNEPMEFCYYGMWNPNRNECCGDGICGDPNNPGSMTSDVNCRQDCGFLAEGDLLNPVCGDGICHNTEDSTSCLIDCDITTLCGDGFCVRPETAENCLIDCSEVICGDGYCTEGAEDEETCELDCADPCGDYVCDYEIGESCETCPHDCFESNSECGCGNEYCVPEFENPINCNPDCFCGDGYCHPGFEEAVGCPEDCGNNQGDVWPVGCGNGYCNSPHENCDHTDRSRYCPQDCGPCGYGCYM